MQGKLVYKTDDKYIELFPTCSLECIDYSCHEQIGSEEKLRDIFSVEIDNLDGEFKILVDPQEMNLKELMYHKDMYDFNHLQEINVRYDCSKKEEFIKRIADMMNNSDEVLDRLFDRFIDFFDDEQKKRYMLGKIHDNLNARLNVIGYFLEDRFDEKDSYLFVRQLEEFCRNIYEMDLEINNSKKIRG